MTPEQSHFVAMMTRVMRGFGRVFLIFWLAVCAVFAASAVWLLITAVSRQDTSQAWLALGVLLGSTMIGIGGLFFIRFWLRSLERMRSEMRELLPPTSTAIPETTPPTDGDKPPSRLMSTSAHLGLQVAATVAGMVAAMVAFFLLMPQLKLSSIAMTVALGLLGAAATTLPRMLVWLIPARCPQCDGPAYCRGSQPIRFECRRCGLDHDTGISMTTGDGES